MPFARFKKRSFWARLLQEFWFAATVATGWVIFKLQANKFVLSDVITDFTTSFFFAAWFTGQFVRVDRQQSVDENLTVIRDELTAYTTTMHKVTELQSELLQRAQSDPVLAKLLIEVSQLTREANTHLLSANSSLVALTARTFTTSSPELGRPTLTVAQRSD